MSMKLEDGGVVHSEWIELVKMLSMERDRGGSYDARGDGGIVCWSVDGSDDADWVR